MSRLQRATPTAARRLPVDRRDRGAGELAACLRRLAGAGLVAMIAAGWGAGTAWTGPAPRPGPGEQPKQPAMTVFYRVGPDGTPLPEDPVESGFALDASGSHAPLPAPVQLPAIVVLGHIPGAAPQLSIRIGQPQAARSDDFTREFEAFRCERHGLFYTSRGRCVVPAFKPAHPGRDRPARLSQPLSAGSHQDLP